LSGQDRSAPGEGHGPVCEDSAPAPVYHLAPLSELKRGTRDGRYAPDRLPADGFVHCSPSVETALAVARDLFVGVDEPVVCLEIDVARLSAPVRWEDPAPPPGAATDHLVTAARFPHVYGPVDLAAVRGAGVLCRRGGGFGWPEAFASLDEVLDLGEGRGAAAPPW